jgi:hypothetical protein
MFVGRPTVQQDPWHLGRWDEAERHFADALAMNERVGARPTSCAPCAPGPRCSSPAAHRAGHARELIAAGRAEAETLDMAREFVRFERLSERMASP